MNDKASPFIILGLCVVGFIGYLVYQHKEDVRRAKEQVDIIDSLLYKHQAAFQGAQDSYNTVIANKDEELKAQQILIDDSKKREKDLLLLAKQQAGAAQGMIDQFPEVKAYVTTLLLTIEEKDKHIGALEAQVVALEVEVSSSKIFIKELIRENVKKDEALRSLRTDISKILRIERGHHLVSALKDIGVAGLGAYLLIRGATK